MSVRYSHTDRLYISSVWTIYTAAWKRVSVACVLIANWHWYLFSVNISRGICNRSDQTDWEQALTQLSVLFFSSYNYRQFWLLALTMASEAGEREKKVKLNYSYVHEEFEVITSHYHPGLEKFGEARKCKECGSIITGTNATNLKAHLKSKHHEWS